MDNDEIRALLKGPMTRNVAGIPASVLEDKDPLSALDRFAGHCEESLKRARPQLESAMEAFEEAQAILMKAQEAGEGVQEAEKARDEILSVHLEAYALVNELETQERRARSAVGLLKRRMFLEQKKEAPPPAPAPPAAKPVLEDVPEVLVQTQNPESAPSGSTAPGPWKQVDGKWIKNG